MTDLVRIEPAMLHGSVAAPPSKSLAHRAIIAAALADGESRIHNIAQSADILATLRCMRALGAKCRVNAKTGTAVVAQKKARPKGPLTLDCGESGSTLRFLIPLALLHGAPVTFVGHGRLMQRPLGPYFEIFREKGIRAAAKDGSLTVEGSLPAGRYRLPGDVSSQFVSGLLFALPLLQGDSEIVLTSPLESKGYVDMTIEVLRQFGIRVENRGYRGIRIAGGQRYRAQDYTVEGDYSQAAFFLVAGALGCDVRCTGLRPDSLQGDKAILELIRQTGALVEQPAEGCFQARRTAVMHGIRADVREIPDLVPILAVLCAFCPGESRIEGAARLRIKESDRLSAITHELRQMGADITEGSDSLLIRGRDMLCACTTSAWNDHRIAMALAIAACRVEGEVLITGAQEAVKKSYPDFFDVYARLAKPVRKRLVQEPEGGCWQ